MAAICLLAACAVCRADGAEQVVAVVADMSGPQAYSGHGFLKAATLAVKALVASGGLLGETLRTVEVDDGCSGDRAEAAAQKALAQHPAVIIGHDCSAASIRAAPFYERAGVLEISPSSTSPRLTEMGIATLFRVTGRDDHQADAAAQLIAKRWPDEKIAILDDQELYGHGLADALRQDLAAAGVPVMLNQIYASGAPDYGALARTLKTAGISLIYVGGYGADLARLMRDIRGAGVSALVLTGDGGNADMMWDIAGPAAEGLLFTQAPDLMAAPSAFSVVKLSKQNGVALSNDSLLAYAAVEIWADAVKRAHSFKAAPVAEAMRSGKFDTSIGTVGFDAKGDIVGPAGEWAWFTWREGKIQPAGEP